MLQRLCPFILSAALLFGCLAAPAFAVEGETSDTIAPEYAGEGAGPPEATPEPSAPAEEPEHTPAPEEAPGDSAPLPSQAPEGESAPGERPMHQQALPEENHFEGTTPAARVKALVTDSALCDSLFPGRSPQSVVFEAEVAEGPLAGSTVLALRELDEAQAAYARPLGAGDSVYLRLYRDETGTARGAFGDFRRLPALAAAGVVALLLLLLCVPRRGGFKLLAVLLVSFAAVGFVLVRYPSPAALIPVLAGLVALSGVVLFGIKYHTLAACLGAAVSLAAAAALQMAGEAAFKLSGVFDAAMLSGAYKPGMALNLRTVLLAGTLLAVTGGLVCVAGAVAAGADPADAPLGTREAFRRAVRRGAPALTPVTLTLCLVQAGSLFGSAALLYAGGASAARILSEENVAAALTRLIACLGALALCVPVTALFAALLLRLRTKPDGVRELHVREAIVAKEHELFGRAAEKLDAATRSTESGTDEVEEDLAEAETALEAEMLAEEAALDAEAPRKPRAQKPRKKPDTRV